MLILCSHLLILCSHCTLYLGGKMGKVFDSLIKWQESFGLHRKRIAILLIGISGSGKSTIAEEFSRHGWRVVSSDGIRKELSATNDELDQTNNPIGEIKRRIIVFAKERQNVVIDATHADKIRRREMVDFLHRWNYLVLGVWLDTPLDICLSRNLNRDKPRPLHVLCNMHSFLWGGPVIDERGKQTNYIRQMTLPSITLDHFDGLWRVDLDDWD